jgi:hypothetical protein
MYDDNTCDLDSVQSPFLVGGDGIVDRRNDTLHACEGQLLELSDGLPDDSRGWFLRSVGLKQFDSVHEQLVHVS